jgi:hypothetical protein
MYLLHHNFKALAKFKQFVEIQINNQIKVLRTNNGCEYKLNEFTQFCEKSQMQNKFKISNTPQ